jgi:pyruvate dehydrogenase kinase 2/3/4
MRLTCFLRQQQPALSHLIDHYAQYPPTGLTMKKIVEFAREGDAKQSFLFLRNELPVRLASMMKEMAHLPPRLLDMPSVKTVKDWYGISLTDMHTFKGLAPTTEIVQKFTEALQNIRKRHSTVVETLAQGYMEFSDLGPVKEYEESQIQYFLNRFYLSRISIRLLIYQHTMCFGDEVPQHPTHLGFVDPHCRVQEIIKDAFENAQFLCEGYYLTAPVLDLRSMNATHPDEIIQIPYVPSHLYHIMFELFKNSMRATVEHAETTKSSDKLSPITVDVVKAKEDLTIRISDRGGGVPRSKADKIFKYMYSTAPRPVSLIDAQHSGPTPLAGFGYGLPLSRLYARYFNGDMEIHSIDGFGTDAYIYLQAVEDQASEWLPICNRASYEYYISRKYQSDWTKKK